MLFIWQVIVSSLLVALATAKPQARIAGGHSGIPSMAPYTVSIQNPTHICNGAIISESYILTAASCVGELPLGSVLVGTQNLDTNLPQIAIKNAVRHPNYEEYSFLNDIAVVELATPLTFSTRIAKIELNRQTVESGWATTTSGWGMIEGYTLPDNMQMLYQKSVSYVDCHRRYADQPEFRRGLVCAYVQRGMGLCFSDNGAPLVANKQLIGVASYVSDCHANKPDIYADVAYHYDWIQSVIKG